MSGYVTSGSRRLTLSAVGDFGSGTRHLIGQDFEPSSTTKNVRTNCSELTDPIPRSYEDSMRTTTTVRRLYGRLVAQTCPTRNLAVYLLVPARTRAATLAPLAGVLSWLGSDPDGEHPGDLAPWPRPRV